MDSAEEPHNLPKEALKEEDFENEWMEQKVNLKKLPQQYMQLSKIRLTGCINISWSIGQSNLPEKGKKNLTKQPNSL